MAVARRDDAGEFDAYEEDCDDEDDNENETKEEKEEEEEESARSRLATTHNDGVTYRSPQSSDIEALSHQWYSSYNSASESHGANQLPIFATLSSARSLVAAYVNSHEKFGLLAIDKNGRIIASGFHDEADVALGSVGVGPYTVCWALIHKGYGRALFTRMLHYSFSRGARSFRLLHGVLNSAAYALYATMGFEVKENLVFMKGTIPSDVISTITSSPLATRAQWKVSEWTVDDVAAIDAFWTQCTGMSRRGTLAVIAKEERISFPRIVVKEGEKIM